MINRVCFPTVEVPVAGEAREGEREENCGWNAFHPGQHPKRACGPRRLLAYMEDTWHHCGISNTWSFHCWEKNWCSNFRLWVTSLKVSNQKTERMKKSTYNWAKKFQSKSKWHKTIELFLCLFLQILTVHIVEDGFASAEVSTLCQVPRSKVTKRKISAFFTNLLTFGTKKGGSKLLNYWWIPVTPMVSLGNPGFLFHPKTPTAAVTSIRISSEVEPQGKLWKKG